MKKLSTVFAIALFLSIPLVASATPVGSANMNLSAQNSLPNVIYLVDYYGTITGSPPFPYNTGSQHIFCISDVTMSSGNFEFNKIDGGVYKNYAGTILSGISAQVSEAAWLADYYQSYTNDGKATLWQDAQLAIWKIMFGLSIPSQYTTAALMYGDASGHSSYTTDNWYAAFDAQDFLVPVPEPGILILLGIALSAVGLASRRYRF